MFLSLWWIFLFYYLTLDAWRSVLCSVYYKYHFVICYYFDWLVVFCCILLFLLNLFCLHLCCYFIVVIFCFSTFCLFLYNISLGFIVSVIFFQLFFFVFFSFCYFISAIIFSINLSEGVPVKTYVWCAPLPLPPTIRFLLLDDDGSSLSSLYRFATTSWLPLRGSYTYFKIKIIRISISLFYSLRECLILSPHFFISSFSCFTPSGWYELSANFLTSTASLQYPWV